MPLPASLSSSSHRCCPQIPCPARAVTTARATSLLRTTGLLKLKKKKKEAQGEKYLAFKLSDEFLLISSILVLLRALLLSSVCYWSNIISSLGLSLPICRMGRLDYVLHNSFELHYSIASWVCQDKYREVNPEDMRRSTWIPKQGYSFKSQLQPLFALWLWPII